MPVLRFELELEVSSPAVVDDEVKRDILALLKKRAKFEGYSRMMKEIAVSPVGCREVHDE